MNTISLVRAQSVRRAAKATLAFLLVLTALVFPVFAAAYPKPTDNVADSAGILSEGTIRSIKNANEVTAEEVGAVIAVCTVSTTGETPIGEYARGVFNDWKLGESILILIAVDDMNYYFLQSTAIDKVLTNDELREITNEYLENDFVEGTTDTGVMKVAAKLSSILSSRLPKIETNTGDTAAEGTTVGSVIVGFFKTILIIVLIAVALFVALFIIAMFNDDVAALFQKYIFRKKHKTTVPVVEYDERLYGAQQRRPAQNGQSTQQRPVSERPQNRAQNGYNYTGYNNYVNNPQADEYYNANGTRRR